MKETGNSWKFHTYLNQHEAEEHTNSLVQQIKKPVIPMQVGTEVDFNPIFPAEIVGDPLPIICILNGAGAGGKGTFASLVNKASTNGAIELSTIDPARPAAEALLKCSEDIAKPYRNVQRTSEEIIDEKGDSYRQLLFDIKQAWDKMDHASQRYGIAEIMKIIDEHLIINLSGPELCYGYTEARGFKGASFTKAFTKLHNSIASCEYENWMSHKNMRNPFSEHLQVVTTGMPNIIFMNIREPANIKRFRAECLELGFLCLTLLIDGRTSTGVWENDADTQVGGMRYDVVIGNKLDTDSLAASAFIFAKFVERANMMYGVSSEASVKSSLMGKYYDGIPATEPTSK